MSIVVKLIIGGWSTAVVMFGLLALNESGKLFKVRRRIALWLENIAEVVRTSEEQPEHEKTL